MDLLFSSNSYPLENAAFIVVIYPVLIRAIFKLFIQCEYYLSVLCYVVCVCSFIYWFEIFSNNHDMTSWLLSLFLLFILLLSRLRLYTNLILRFRFKFFSPKTKCRCAMKIRFDSNPKWEMQNISFTLSIQNITNNISNEMNRWKQIYCTW